MKQVNLLFFISVGRAGVLSTLNKLVLCLLIPLGVLITGCDIDTIIEDRNMENLSEESLNIHSLTIDKSTLPVGEATKLEAELKDYEGDTAKLKYYWSVNGGEIHGMGKSAIYVAPKEKGSYTIILQVSNGIISVSDFRIVEVCEPPAPSMPSGDSMKNDKQ